MILLLFFVFSIFNVCFCNEPSPIVSLPLGIVEGFIKTSAVNNRQFYAFEGIPYAKPPVGKYRFKAPVPIKPWNETWQAKTMFKCMQYDHLTPPGQDFVAGDEDCLYVNVYTPDLYPSKKLNVLVYIHGGALMFLYGGYYGPNILLDRDIVYVNLNYRLGPLGFLSTEDDILPGNNGFKDQILALKWIKNNIQYFGGDPNSITISGMSAGGASTEFHYLFKDSAGLFQRGISQSGCVLNPWVIMEDALQKTQQVAALVGCPSEDSKKIVQCLRQKPARQIVYTVKEFQPWLYNPFSPFGAVVDIWASKPLLTEHPYKLLQNKQVYDIPWIISYTSSEGLYPAADFYTTDNINYINQNWNDVIPYIFHYNDAVKKDKLDFVSEKIREKYLEGQNLTTDNFQQFVKAVSDRLFVMDIEKAARLHSAAVKSSVYSYYFDYRGKHSISESMCFCDDDLGVSHADDNAYIFHTTLDTLSTEDDRAMSKILVDMFISFMETGKPNTSSDWKPLPKNPAESWVQLHISNPQEIFVEEVKTELGNNEFWESLPIAENEKLFNIKDEL